jgi:hypothetical protein
MSLVKQMGMSVRSSLLPESHIHDMIVPYFVIESARFGDRARHVLFKGAELASQMEPGLFKAPSPRHPPQKSIRSTFILVRPQFGRRLLIPYKEPIGPETR